MIEVGLRGQRNDAFWKKQIFEAKVFSRWLVGALPPVSTLGLLGLVVKKPTHLRQFFWAQGFLD
jgi:hypothetical protein